MERFHVLLLIYVEASSLCDLIGSEYFHFVWYKILHSISYGAYVVVLLSYVTQLWTIRAFVMLPLRQYYTINVVFILPICGANKQSKDHYSSMACTNVIRPVLFSSQILLWYNIDDIFGSSIILTVPHIPSMTWAYYNLWLPDDGQYISCAWDVRHNHWAIRDSWYSCWFMPWQYSCFQAVFICYAPVQHKQLNVNKVWFCHWLPFSCHSSLYYSLIYLVVVLWQ